MTEFIEHKNVPVSDLLLDTENYRYKQGTLSDQRGCIDKIVGDSKANIVGLAEDIAQNGLFPEPILAQKEGKQWKVLEGNRRVTALKLLNNPSLCHDDKKRQKLQAIRQQHSKSIPKTVTLHTCKDASRLHEHILRRHTGENNGIGLKGWSAAEIENFLVRNGRKSRYGYGRQVLDALDGKVAVGDNFPITTLDRILKNKEARELLGLSVQGGELLGSKEVLDILKAIVTDLKSGAKTVTDLKKKEQIVAYVQSKGANGSNGDTAIPISPAGAKGAASGGAANAAAATTASGKTTKKAKASHARTTIVPADTTIFVPTKNGKCRDIMIELQNIRLNDSRHASALLLRAFIELSVRHYAKAHKIPLSVNKKGKTTEKHLNVLLDDVCKHLQAANHITGGDRTRTTGNTHKAISVSDFNGYAHDPDAWPVPDQLIACWEAMKQVLELCWVKA